MEKVIKFLNTLFLTLILIIVVVPFVIVVMSSFSSEQSIMINGCSLFPKEFSLSAYKYIFDNPWQLLNSYKTTIIVTLVGTFLSVFMQAGAAYPLSRRDFKWRRPLSIYIYITMLFSGGIIPTYILVSKYLHMKDTIWVLFVPILCGGFNIFLLRTFFQELPPSLIEAAKLDGAHEYYIFFRIVLPLMTAGIATVTLTTVLGFWNNWFQSMLYISNDKIVTLQYLLMRMLNDVSFVAQASKMMGDANSVGANSTVPLQMATCVLAAGPMLFVFVFFQKYFIKGVTAGAVKE